MLSKFIASLAKQEAANIKRGVAGLVLVLIGAALLLLAMCFAFLALYLGLSTLMAPWKSALVVCALILLVSLILWLAGRARMRRPQRQREEFEQELKAFASAMTPDAPSKEQKMTLIATAAVVGLIIGRRLSK